MEEELQLQEIQNNYNDPPLSLSLSLSLWRSTHLSVQVPACGLGKQAGSQAAGDSLAVGGSRAAYCHNIPGEGMHRPGLGL